MVWKPNHNYQAKLFFQQLSTHPTSPHYFPPLKLIQSRPNTNLHPNQTKSHLNSVDSVWRYELLLHVCYNAPLASSSETPRLRPCACLLTCSDGSAHGTRWRPTTAWRLCIGRWSGGCGKSAIILRINYYVRT